MNLQRRESRSAAVIVVTLVCLLIALSIAATMIAETLTRRVQLNLEAQARQTELLVQAGRGRAVARLAADADYRGERWTPTVASAEATAVVEIALEKADDDMRLTVTATYPEGDRKAVCRSRVYLLTNTNLTPEE